MKGGDIMIQLTQVVTKSTPKDVRKPYQRPTIGTLKIEERNLADDSCAAKSGMGMCKVTWW